MRKLPVEKLAGVLRALVEVTFVCNIIALFLVPALVVLQMEGVSVTEYLFGLFRPGEDGGAADWALLLTAWRWVWKAAPAAASALLLLFCGCCTAVILRQGRRVLDAVLRGTPFCRENAVSFRRAAVAAFAVAAASLVRWGVDVRLLWAYSHSPTASLPACDAVAAPVFAMAGLLSLILSALFRQAAELKAENELTI